MKGKLARVVLTVLTFCMLTVATLSPAHALSWDGSSTGGGGGTSPTSPGGYAVRYTNAESCVVGYRFSVINDSGTTKGLVIDVYKGTGGFNNPKFSTKYNKADLIRRQNNGWSTSTSTYLCIKQSELGISLPAPSGMGVWQEKKSNLNPILGTISPSLSVDNLIYGDKVLVEPIVEIAIAGTYHSFTVTEMALYGKHMLGVHSNGGSSSNSGSWGFIALYTNKNFPNLLRATNGYGIWTGVSSALTKQATFYDIINKGYGVGVAYTQTQNKTYKLDVNGLLEGVHAYNIKGFGTFDVYINGKKVAEDVNDYYNATLKAGDTYKISDIRANTGKCYRGVSSGSLSKTISADAYVQLKFTTNTLRIYYNANGGQSNSETYGLWSDGNVYRKSDQVTIVTQGTYNKPINSTYGVTDGATFGLYRTGYQWLGWNTKADGTGITIGENDLDVVPTDFTSEILTKDATVTLYAQWEETLDGLEVQPIAPNAAYREATQVITSYWLVNENDRDYLPSDGVTLRFDIKDSHGDLYHTLTRSQVVVPANDRNLIYIKWQVPEGLRGMPMVIQVSLEYGGIREIVAQRSYSTIPCEWYQTPDTQFAYAAPNGLFGSAPAQQSISTAWSEYVYEGGRLVRKRYQLKMPVTTVSVSPQSPTAEYRVGSWYMKSGYGFTITAAPVTPTTPTLGYTMAPEDSYTLPQYGYALYPEYGYAYGEGTCTTLSGEELLSLPQFLDYGRVHFTPIWYPDGAYTVAVVRSDCWTPVGMVETISTQTLRIQGSVYDDWYVGRR